jgi:hypothetical protein
MVIQTSIAQVFCVWNAAKKNRRKIKFLISWIKNKLYATNVIKKPLWHIFYFNKRKEIKN